MSEELVVSRPGQIRRGTQLLALPIPQDGETIVVKIRALPRLEILDIIEGVPGVDAGASESVQTVAQAREMFVRNEGHVRKLIEAAVVDPQFYFGGDPVEGKAAWDDLLPDNQAALTKGIMDFSGWKAGAKPEAAAFREGGAGQ